MSGNNKLSRREFIKDAAAAGTGMAALGGLAFAPAVTATAAAPRDQACDVLVVGGLGWAGLITALRAAEQGANVIVVDKQTVDSDYVGGDVLISGHQIHICSNSLQLPSDKLLSLINTQTAGTVIPEVAAAHAGNANRAIKWLINLTKQQFVEPAGNETRVAPILPSPNFWGMIKPGGPNDFRKSGFYHLIHIMLPLLQAKQNVKILGATSALHLLTNDAGAVSGVLAKDAKGTFNINAKSVVLATGGHSRNRDMMMKYLGANAGEMTPTGWGGPTWAGLDPTLCSGKGWGHLLAMEVGAQVKNMSYFGAQLVPEAVIRNPDCYGSISTPLAIAVTNAGQRIWDEGQSNILASIMVKAGIFATGFFILDSAMYTASKVQLDLAKQYGATIHTADTIADLATKAGINPYLATTVSDYNAAIDNGTIKKISIPRAGDAAKIAKAPFYAAPFRVGTWGTFGGLVTNAKGSILDLDGQPIAGLYGAGTVMEGGLSGGVQNATNAYVGCIGTGLVWGIISGESAAANAGAKPV